MSIITGIEKRLKYFKGQFLQAKDFEDEQAYHIDRQRRHNRLFHTPGIAEGLEVSVTNDRKRVKVTAGTAVDIDGCQIFLAEEQIVSLTATGGSAGFAPGQLLLLVISYAEHPSDMATLGVEKNTRCHEEPVIAFVPEAGAPSKDTHIRLARVKLDQGAAGADRTIETLWDDVVREMAGTSAKNISAADIGALKKIDGVENPGGNVDLVQADAITISPDNNQKRIIIGENHSGVIGNPHQTTADDVNALPIDLIEPETGVSVFQRSMKVEHSDEDVATLEIWNTSSSGPYAIRATVGQEPQFVRYDFAAVSARSFTAQKALYVEGNAYIAGNLDVEGTLSAPEKDGYVADKHINASGQRLEIGDVVRLNNTPTIRFRGANNQIPMVEVTLADEDKDTKVFGIVAGEARPERDAPDKRVQPNDPTFIEDGGEVLVVTLGAYSHCKVDAGEAPIEVGDLLTTSSNPGHAKKATDPKIGTIIGKALEPLAEGTGYIAVFVNIQ